MQENTFRVSKGPETSQVSCLHDCNLHIEILREHLLAKLETCFGIRKQAANAASIHLGAGEGRRLRHLLQKRLSHSTARGKHTQT
jgi:hypothetical protein